MHSNASISCLWLFLTVVDWNNIANNNRDKTVKQGFLAATAQFQWPIRVRTYYGGENEEVWRSMLDKRGPKSALVGTSVHNQPIEQFWGLVNDIITLPFKILFEKVMQDGLLNLDNSNDMLRLHWVFLPLIQNNLTRESLALNQRKLSTEHFIYTVKFTLSEPSLSVPFLDTTTTLTDSLIQTN